MSEPDYSPPPQPWTDLYWFSEDGLKLHYRDYAGPDDRPPVLCLHGLTRNARDFAKLAAHLAETRRVIVPDFRGRGLSDHDPVPARYAPPTYADDILKLLDLLHVDKAIFIGTSLGGLVTMAVAALAPQRIAGTVLNDVGPLLEAEGLQRISGYVGQEALFQDWDQAADNLQDRHAGLHPNYERQHWLEFAHRLCCEDETGVRFDYDLAISRNVLAGAQAQSFDAWPLFKALGAAPLLIVRGELSDLLSRATAQRMVAEHPSAMLVEVPGAGHAPDLTEHEAVQAIHQLLDRSL